MIRKVIGLVGTGFLVSVGVVLALVLGIITVVVVSDVADDPIEGVFPRAKTKEAVFVIPVDGEITSSEKFTRILSRALEKDEIKAIVISINSPGGAVGPSEDIHRAIKAADLKKPVFCAMGGVAASGGLYSAVACRKIYANLSTLTGSIGVIMSYPTVPQVMAKAGVEMNVIKSGVLKDVGSPFRAQTPEDKAFLSRLVDTSYQQFINVIAEDRKIPVESVRKFADGRVILGEEAKQLGLIDEIGGVELAADGALKASGSNAKPEILYARPKRSFSSVLEESKVGFFMRSLAGPQLLYRSSLDLY
jgi:protease-4